MAVLTGVVIEGVVSGEGEERDLSLGDRDALKSHTIKEGLD